MRLSIGKKREAKSFKAAVTVMYHDSICVLGGCNPSCARYNAAPPLSGLLAVISDFVADASPQSGLLPLPQRHSSRDRTRSRSLSHTEKFSAEEPMARSALAVSAASPNRRSPQAVATEITTKTEQRRCAAA